MGLCCQVGMAIKVNKKTAAYWHFREQLWNAFLIASEANSLIKVINLKKNE